MTSLALRICIAALALLTGGPSFEPAGSECPAGSKYLAGPEYLSGEIAPIDAPFPMPEFKIPEFPGKTVTARLKKNALNTGTIQKGVDRLSRQGGGTLIIPAGEWKTGRISLKSGVNLHLEEGATLVFSGDIEDYLPAVLTRDEGVDLYSLGACIYANGQHHIALTGKGRILGPSTECEIYRRNETTVPDIEKSAAALPLEQRIYDGKDGGAVFLPKSFSPYECTDVYVEGVHFDRGLFWNVVPQYCEHVLIRGVKVTSHGHGRTDGIDIDSSKDVLIEYCSLDCQDDCYTIKSGRGMDGVDRGVRSENIVIRNCVALRGAGGIVTGTETAGGIRNVYMTECIFDGTSQAFRFKTRRPRGGHIENIYIENVEAKVTGVGLYVDMRGSAKWVGELANRYPAREVGVLTPSYGNISIHDVYVEADRLIDIKALPESPLKTLAFCNVEGSCRSFGAAEDVSALTLKDIKMHSADSVFTIDGCADASIFGFANISSGQSVKIATKGVNEHLLVQEYPQHPVKYNSIRPGEVILDTDGKPIQAHGFQVQFIDGKYWWYGEDKTSTLFGTNRIFCGVRAYSSTDFYNWTDEGDIIEASEDLSSPVHHSQKLERPHIVRSAATGKYVCWLKSQANNGFFVILEADEFTGPYRFVRRLKPCGFAVGDFDMYTDEATGKSYVWFERPHWEYICAELSDDCTDVNGTYSEHFVGQTPPYTREAASHFMVGDKHYMFTSGTTSYYPNPSEVAEFDDYHGEYKVLGNPHIDDPYNHSFCSQITSVIRIPGSNLYVVMADRWMPQTLNTDLPAQQFESFKARYANHRPDPQDFETPRMPDRRYTLVNQNQDVYNATYVFLPVEFIDGVPMIRWLDEWRLEDYR